MSSWVAPSVAAEIWGISVDQVLAGVADGSICSCVDGQFLFVDVRGMGMPDAPDPSLSSQTIVTDQEFAALTFEPIESSEDLSPQDDETGQSASQDVALWRSARQDTARLRRPPEAQAA